MAALAVVGCRGERPPELHGVQVAPIPLPGARSLHVSPGGAVWVGGPGALVAAEGAPAGARVAFAGDTVPRVLDASGSRGLVGAGAQVVMMDLETGEELARRTPFVGVAALNPRMGVALRATGWGEVVAHEVGELEPRWGWGSVGARPTALTVSPLGDRAYIALADTADDGSRTAQILIRDMQTGRVFGQVFFDHPIRALRSGAATELFAVQAGETDGDILAVRHSGTELPVLWRRPLEHVGLGALAELRACPRGERIALFEPENETGLRVLDAETGRQIGRVSRPVLDAAFGADGSLYLLTADAVERVEVRPR